MTTTAAAPPSINVNRAALVMALACGLAVANLYYCQPLLEEISKAFHIGQGTASLAVTFTQTGYAVGLLFLVPLGDMLENRALVTRLLLGTAVALALAAASPFFSMFLVVSVLVGVTSVIVQVLVPLAAHLAPAGQEGAFVGKVMSGLLLGILLARSAASVVAQLVDWRWIYIISAVLMVALSLLLRRTLPRREPTHATSYADALKTVWELVRTEPRLRLKAFDQAMMFGAFTAYWTAIAYELIGEHGFSQGEIAVFALVGAGGAAAAPVAGKIADKGHGETVSVIAMLLGSASFLLARFGHAHVLWLAVAGVLLDFAVQSHQIAGQHVIYALRPTARARINTVYMTTIFVGGTIASAITGVLHSRDGWAGVCWLGFALPLAGLAYWLGSRRSRQT